LSKHCVYLSVLILSLDAVAFYNRGDRTLGKIDAIALLSVPLQWNGKGNFIGKHMDQIIQASDLALHQVKERFNLQQVWDDQFFWEWLG
jgi:hypothetical protein